MTGGAILFIFCGMLFGVPSLLSFLPHYPENSVTTNATIISVEQQWVNDRGGRTKLDNSGWGCSGTLTYATAVGEQLAANTRAVKPCRYIVGQIINVSYNAEEPTDVEIQADDPDQLVTWIFLLISIILIAIGLYLLRGALRLRRHTHSTIPEPSEAIAQHSFSSEPNRQIVEPPSPSNEYASHHDEELNRLANLTNQSPAVTAPSNPPPVNIGKSCLKMGGITAGIMAGIMLMVLVLFVGCFAVMPNSVRIGADRSTCTPIVAPLNAENAHLAVQRYVTAVGTGTGACAASLTTAKFKQPPQDLLRAIGITWGKIPTGRQSRISDAVDSESIALDYEISTTKFSAEVVENESGQLLVAAVSGQIGRP